ncbi:hypothetical protein ACFO0U_09210 [Chromohalobacter sarecensis]|uniref:Uncharacterized protein n=1 Tax=Chromohalobacter sarecensis TaxID=245294 RepID=A0ABV9D1Q1_9GAMM|nr:hypothetical protein [Chromohalobacter sarecensis]
MTSNTLNQPIAVFDAGVGSYVVFWTPSKMSLPTLVKAPPEVDL